MKDHNIVRSGFLISLFLVSVFLPYCNDRDSDNASQEILNNVVEHEWTIGGDNYEFKDEFILSFPFGIVVKDNGDIIVADENRLKVFDSTGNGKLIVGKPGEGPGEFDKTLYAAHLTLNQGGELTVSRGDRFYVFTSDYEFIESGGKLLTPKQNLLLEQSNMFSGFVNTRRLVSINDKEKIYSMDALDKFPGVESLMDFFIFETSDTLLVIKKANGTGYIKEARIFIPTVLGRIIFAQLPGNKIIYTHSGHDFESQNNRNSYILKVISLDTFEEGTINHTYDKIEIDYESEINTIKTYISPGNLSRASIE